MLSKGNNLRELDLVSEFDSGWNLLDRWVPSETSWYQTQTLLHNKHKHKHQRERHLDLHIHTTSDEDIYLDNQPLLTSSPYLTPPIPNPDASQD